MTDRPDAPVIELVSWTGPVPPEHPDANFLADVATYSLADPLATLQRLADAVGLPVGALARSVLAKWVAAGSDGLLEAGPTAITRLRTIVAAAEEEGTDQARLAAYDELARQLSWLGHGLDDPVGTYPDGGATPLRDHPEDD